MIARLLPMALLATAAGAQTPPDTGWSAYGRTAGGDRHSPLTQITPANVATLAPAWTFHTGEAGVATGRPIALETTPILVDGLLYVSSPLGKIFALDPVTGTVKWQRDFAVSPKLGFGDWVSRGVSFWRDAKAPAGQACASRIVAALIDARLVSIDARDGTDCAQFGVGGTVDLKASLRSKPAWPDEYEQTSPPAIIGDVIVLGSAIADNSRVQAASGEVRGFDARTGGQLWSWDPVPQHEGDPAFAEWGEEGRKSGAANAWSVIAADPARGLVFVPTSSPSVDYYGGTRPGDNAHANSISALHAEDGSLAWSFQTVHHDLWDYDNAAPPALVTIERGGKQRDVVLQATKTGQLFVLDRDTGAPVFAVKEQKAPPSDVPGETPWPTQPVSAELPPLSPQRVTAKDMWGPTPEIRKQCADRLATLRNDGPFTPPSLKGTLVMPANIGGAQWGGLSYDAARGIVVVPVNRVAAVITLIPRADYKDGADTGEERIGTEYAGMRGTPFVLKRETFLSPASTPCTAPPFGSLVGLSLKTGKIVWDVPLGTGEGLEKFGIKGAEDVKGMISLGGPITTAAGLTFIGATTDAYLRAFDTASGKEVWKAKLPAGGKATPMTYLGADGRQYVVISAGGDGKIFGSSDAVMAFALPKP